MQFKPELIKKILSGEKTQTRRPDKGLDWLLDKNDTPIYTHVIRDDNSYARKFRIVYQIGKSYAVCPGRGKKQVARIQIDQIRKVDVRLILPQDVKAEGFNTALEFWLVWTGFYDNLTHNDLKSLHVSERDAQKYLLSMRSYERYWAWALTFHLVKD